MEELTDYTANADKLLNFLQDGPKGDKGWVEISSFLVDGNMATSNDMINVFLFLLDEKRGWIEVTPRLKYQFNTNVPWSDPRTTQIKARLTQAGIDEVIRRRTADAELILKRKQNDSFDKVAQSAVDSAEAAKTSADTTKSALKSSNRSSVIMMLLTGIATAATVYMALNSSSGSTQAPVQNTKATGHQEGLLEGEWTTKGLPPNPTDSIPKNEPEKEKNDGG